MVLVKWWLSVLLMVVSASSPSQGTRGTSNCDIPSEWFGRWFETGEREGITIDQHNITHKGQCLYRSGDMYIFRDVKHNCYRCAVVHQKHRNVLQYKESYCQSSIGRRKVDLCNQLTAETPLKSMFRLDFDQYEDCPLEGGFSFTYSRGHGLCEYPKSSLSQCSVKSKFVVHYQACADIKGSESSREEVNCLAKWKEGSTFYFLGLVNHSHVLPTDFEGRFRCFAYQSIYEGFLVSQSGEAVCTLHSAKEGDRTMTLKRTHNFKEHCALPEWLVPTKKSKSLDQAVYENLNGSIHYHLRTHSIFMNFRHHHHPLDPSWGARNADGASHASTGRPGLSLNCNSIEEDNPDAKSARLVMQVDFDCEGGFVCMEVVRKSSTILLLRTGKLSRNQEEACNVQLFFDTAIPFTTIIDAAGEAQRCPLVGKYSLVSRNDPNDDHGSHEDEALCQQNVNSKQSLMFGCSGESDFSLITRCGDAPSGLHASSGPNEYFREQGYTCFGGWKESNVGKSQSDQSNLGLLGGGLNTERAAMRFPEPVVSTQIMIVSPSSSKRKLCLKLVTRELDQLILSTSLQPCDHHHHHHHRQSRTDAENISSHFQGHFLLTRQSECAQALATANRGSLMAAKAGPAFFLPILPIIFYAGAN